MNKKQFKKLIGVITEAILLNEASYRLPNDGSQIFWDFYSLYTAWYFYGSGHPTYYPRDEFHPSVSPLPEAQRKYIDDLFESCLFQLSRSMLHYLEKIIYTEFRHYVNEGGFEAHYHLRNYIKNPKYFEQNVGKMDKKQIIDFLYSRNDVNLSYDLFKKIVCLSEKIITNNVEHIISHNISQDDEDDRSTASERVFKILKQICLSCNITEKDIIEYFDYAPWSTDYGGSSWADIVKVFLELKKNIDSDPKHLLTIIDKIYDMEHNTGSVLNKGNLLVLKSELDIRSELKDLESFLYVGKQSLIVKNLIKNLVNVENKLKSKSDKKYYSGENYNSSEKKLYDNKLSLNGVDKNILLSYGFEDISMEVPNSTFKKYLADGSYIHLAFYDNGKVFIISTDNYSKISDTWLSIPFIFKYLYERFGSDSLNKEK